MDLVTRWHALEAAADARGLGDGVYLAPAGLRWARPSGSPRGAVLPELPADYRAFIEALDGYPVFGLRYYDRRGWSFLPPSAMEALSVDVADQDDVWPHTEGGVTTCVHAFFAGIELSDYQGWSFGPDDAGATVVWEVDGMAREPLGSFTEWMTGRLDEALARITDADDADLEMWREALAAETDPHRLIDYSIERRLTDIPRRTDADRALNWVCDQQDTPYRYGLIDDAGVWRIKPRPYYGVSPFTGGVAEVIEAKAGSSYGGPWVRIGVDGARLDE